MEKTIVAVFSYHGTEFFEHGGVDHGHSLYDELVHVPLLIYSPKLPSARVVPEQISTIDILLTLLELSGLISSGGTTQAALPSDLDRRIRRQMKGQSLMKPMTGQGFVPRTAYMESDLRNAVNLRGLRTADGWKYIASKCEVQIAYAIGVARPVSLMVNTYGSGKIADEQIIQLIENHFDLRPRGIIHALNLLRPIYARTAAYGHFGRELPEFTWEVTDKANQLRSAAGI